MKTKNLLFTESRVIFKLPEQNELRIEHATARPRSSQVPQHIIQAFNDRALSASSTEWESIDGKAVLRLTDELQHNLSKLQTKEKHKMLWDFAWTYLNSFVKMSKILAKCFTTDIDSYLFVIETFNNGIHAINDVLDKMSEDEIKRINSAWKLTIRKLLTTYYTYLKRIDGPHALPLKATMIQINDKLNLWIGFRVKPFGDEEPAQTPWIWYAEIDPKSTKRPITKQRYSEIK